MPISAEQWRVSVGQANASRSLRPHVTSLSKRKLTPWDVLVFFFTALLGAMLFPSMMPVSSKKWHVSVDLPKASRPLQPCGTSQPIRRWTSWDVVFSTLLDAMLLSGDDGRATGQRKGIPRGRETVGELVPSLVTALRRKQLLIIAGDVETNPGPDLPTLTKCLRFQGRERRINIPQEISVKYYQLGRLLLDDDTGATVRSIAHKHRDDAKQITLEILEEWIAGRGIHPVTWKTLTHVLHDIDLSTLASEIEATKYHEEIEAVNDVPPNQADAQAILEEALEKGYVDCHIWKVLVTGAAGSGKTTLKHRLFGEEPPSLRCSTALAEAAIRAISREIVGTNVTAWFRVTCEELMELLGGALKAGIPMERSPSGTTGVVAHRQPPKGVSSSKQELVQLVEKSQGSKRFLELQWIHFIDSGGQPQFHEVLPAFIGNTTATIFVMKLSERLDEHPMIEYYDSIGELCGKSYPHALSNYQMLQCCVQTIHSQPSREGKHSKTLIVGTHRDLESSRSESRAEKNRKLVDMLMPILQDELVLFSPRLQDPKVIFPINAKNPDEHDHHVCALIRKQVEDKKCAPPPYKIPIGWFLLEQDIIKASLGVISRSECLGIAAILNMNAKTLKAALQYFHDLNIFLYYPSVLQEVVFCNPQILLDKVTELVHFSYCLQSDSPPVALEGKWLQFRDRGVVTVDMLKDERFSTHYILDLFTPEDLIELFKHLLIIAPLSSTEYFMPSLLHMITPEQVRNLLPPPSSSVAPLLVHFPAGCAQNGVFCALLVYLLSKCHWKFAKGTLKCVSRNCVHFRLPDTPVSITLVDSFIFFEVHVQAPCIMYPKVCPMIRETILSGLKAAAASLRYINTMAIPAFFCKCSSPCHAAIPFIDDDDCYLMCTKSTSYEPLTKQHTVWLDVDLLEKVATANAQKILEEALKKGYVLCHIWKVLVTGAAGSGKTSLKHCLLKEKPPGTRSSTGVAETAIRAISRLIVGINQVGWSRVTNEKLIKMLGQILKAHGIQIEESRMLPSETHEAGVLGQSSKKSTTDEIMQLQPKSNVPSLDPALVPFEIQLKEDSESCHESTAHLSTLAENISTKEELVQLIAKSEGSKQLVELQWIYFIDSGGQPQFHELLPAFIGNTTATIFVMKLSESLDDHPIIEYYETGQACNKEYSHELSNSEILQCCVQTMLSRPQAEQNYSKTLIVGTHRDLEHLSSESRAEKNKKLIAMLEPLQNQLVYYRLGSEVIFPMNAQIPEEQDQILCNEIRKQFEIKKPPPYKIPIGWFLLEQEIIKSSKNGVISKNICLRLAQSLQIKPEALAEALKHFHKLNTFLYYPVVLPEVVFSNPQVLLNKATELVRFSYCLRSNSASVAAEGNRHQVEHKGRVRAFFNKLLHFHSSQQSGRSEALQGKWMLFRDKGIVTLEMLEDERFSAYYIPDLFSPADLIKLFRHLLIIAPLSSTEYFMPSLLQMTSRKMLTKQLPPPSTSVAPMLVHFPAGCAQNGIFCALVVYLHSHCNWKFAKGTPDCVSRNFVHFQLSDKPVCIALVDRFAYFEVHVRARNAMYPKVCPYIRKDIFSGLKAASKALRYHPSEPKTAFFCKCNSSHKHAATIDDENCFLLCTLSTNSEPLTTQHAVWLDVKLPAAKDERWTLHKMICSILIIVAVVVLAFVGMSFWLPGNALNCGNLTNPVNGQVTHTAGTFGETATYSCDPGYNLVGTSTRTCQITGTWSGNEPTCQSVDCGTLSNLTYGQVSHTGTSFQQTATYSCNPGYELVGDRTHVCLATGVWSGSAPTCKPAGSCHSITKKQDLERAVAEIGKWKTLCEYLGVNKVLLNGLDNLKDTDGSIKKSECLDAYLNTGKACWEQVVQVVNGFPFYNARIAKEIAYKYGIDYSSVVKDEL